MTQNTKTVSSDEKAIRIGGAAVCFGLSLITSVVAVRTPRDAQGNVTPRAGNFGLLTTVFMALASAFLHPITHPKAAPALPQAETEAGGSEAQTA